MLRPNDVISWFQNRAQRGQNELSQLFDGVVPGGSVVVGGSESNMHRAVPTLSAHQRIGRVMSMATAKLDPERPTTFDTAAIVQLLLIAKNEAFHESCEAMIKLIETVVADGRPVEVALQVARDQAAQVQKL